MSSNYSNYKINPYNYELNLFQIIVLALMKEMVSRDALGDYSKLMWIAIFFGMSPLITGASAISTLYSQKTNRKLRNSLLDYLQQEISPFPFKSKKYYRERVKYGNFI